MASKKDVPRRGVLCLCFPQAVQQTLLARGEGFDELGEVRLAAGSGILVENTLDHRFVQNGLGFIEPALGKFVVPALNGLENALSRSLATTCPVAVVKPVSLGDTHSLFSGFLVRQCCHLLRHEQRPF